MTTPISTVLLTGGSGFVGKNLALDLSRRYTVLAPTHAELELTSAEQVAAYLDTHEVDAVIHSATKPGHRNAVDPTGLVEPNLRMFFNLARCSDRFARLIFLGTGAEYDMRFYQPKMPEEYFDAHVPVDETGFSKYVISKHIERMDNAVDLRMFGVFGPYEDYAIRFISNAICKTLFDLPITLRQNRLFDYLYVRDLAPVVEYFLDNDASHKAYNVTPDASVDLLSLARMVRDVSGKDLPILVGQEGMGLEYSGENSRLRAEIPAIQFTPIESAVRGLYTWYDERRSQLNRDVLLVDR